MPAGRRVAAGMPACYPFRPPQAMVPPGRPARLTIDNAAAIGDHGQVTVARNLGG